jgi:hypothetical protein
VLVKEKEASMEGLKRSIVLATLALSLSTVMAGRARSQVVVNGSFEADQIGSPFFSTNPSDIPGWTHTGAPGDALLWHVGYSDGGGSITVAGQGTQFVTMGGGSAASGTGNWSQTVAGFTPGTSYALSFQMASEENLAQTITVSFPTGSSTGPMNFTAPVSSVNYWRTWVNESEIFIATASSVTLQFSATTIFDVGLDNVSVSLAVPEPSCLALAGTAGVVGAGYGGAGAGGRGCNSPPVKRQSL